MTKRDICPPPPEMTGAPMVDLHGDSKYANDRCRCEVCKGGWTSYVGNRKAQRKAWVAENGLP